MSISSHCCIFFACTFYFMYIFIWLLKKAFFFFFFCLPATEPPNRKVAHLFPDFFVHLCMQLVPATHFLTDLEKARQTKARSKKPVPRTWRVLRLTESHTRTWGASSCRGRENILFLTQLEHNSGKNASYFLFMTAVVKKKKLKCQRLPLTLPSEEVPDAWPVAMVILSGWTARLVKRKHTWNFIWTSKRARE